MGSLSGDQMRQPIRLGLEAGKASDPIVEQELVGRRHPIKRVGADVDDRDQPIEAESVNQNACRVVDAGPSELAAMAQELAFSRSRHAT